MEYLGVSDEAIDVGLSEEICRGGDEQHLSALLIQWELDRHCNVFFDLFFQSFQGVGQCRFGQTEIVADGVDFADDLVGVFLTQADRSQDLAACHGDLGRIDSVGAIHRAAPALGALVVVTVPVFDDLLAQLHRSDQPGKILASQGEVAPVNLAQQVLARNWHVFWIASTEVVMALVSTGTTLDAHIQEHLQ